MVQATTQKKKVSTGKTQKLRVTPTKAPSLERVVKALRPEDESKMTAVLEHLVGRTRWRGENGAGRGATRVIKGFQTQRDINATKGRSHVSVDDVRTFFLAMEAGGYGEVDVVQVGHGMFSNLVLPEGFDDTKINETVRELWAAYKGTKAPAPAKEARTYGRHKYPAEPKVVDPARIMAKVEQRRAEAPETPSYAALEAHHQPLQPLQPLQPSGGSTILVQLRGCEFELDLALVPKDILKFRRIL